MPRPPRHVTLRYMTEFRCLGAACEDNCCKGWTVPVDQGHFVKLRRLLEREPGGAERFAKTFVQRPAAERGPQSFASITMDDRGNCPMLDEDRWCSLHRRHGEAVLPNSCAMYPRSVARVGDRLELSGALSCPEVARRALLTAGATDVVPAPEPLLGRALTQHDSSRFGAAAPALVDQARAVALQLLGLTDYPLRSRLFCLAFITHRATQLADQAPHGAHDLAKVMAEVSGMGLLQVIAGLHQKLEEGPAPLPHGLSVVASIIGRRIDMRHDRSAFHRVVAAVMESYAAEPDSGVTLSEDGTDLTLDSERLSLAYARRRAAALARHGERVEQYFHHYARHGWLHDGILESPSLWLYTQGLLLRMALLRFLLLSHPAAAGEDVARLDAAAVEVCYAFARIVEHTTRFNQGIDQFIAGQLAGIPHAILLLGV